MIPKRRLLTRDARAETAGPDAVRKTYSYDALGRRVSKALSDRTVSYSYDGQKVIEETVTDLSGNVLRSSEFVYGAAGDDDALAEFRTESGTTVTLYYAKDRLGSTAAVTDASGNVIEEYRHSAFGSPYRKLADGTWEALGKETETLSGTVRPEPLTDRLYTGREWDSESGLHHYRARAYSPELGRFLQRDPVGTADQMNPYAYVRNNPMMWTDPTGMFCAATAGKEMAKGAAMGDLMEDQNGWNVAGQVGLGFTPAGIIGDARDFAYNMSNCSGWGCAGTAAVGAAAFIPLAGDAVKHGAKAYKARKAVRAEDLKIAEQLAKHDGDLQYLLSVPRKGIEMRAGETYFYAQHTKSDIQDIAESITRNYGVFQCKECATALMKKFEKSGVDAELLKFESYAKTVWMDGKNSASDAIKISDNRDHHAVFAAGMVFDNISKKGIPYNEFVDKLGVGSWGGRFIK